MSAVNCALIDCYHHAGHGKRCQGTVDIDKFGEPICYEPRSNSKLIHAPFKSGVKQGGRRRTMGMLK